MIGENEDNKTKTQGSHTIKFLSQPLMLKIIFKKTSNKFLVDCTYAAVGKIIILLIFPIIVSFFMFFFYLHIFFNFNFYFILLYNTVLVLPYIDMNLPQVHMGSQTHTPLPPPTPYHPSGPSPCTSPKHPVSCIKHRLAIRFLHDSIHVRMPFSQIIPPSPSPSESKSPLYTSVSLLLSRIQGHHYHLSKFHIYVLVYCTGVFLSGSLHSV